MLSPVLSILAQLTVAAGSTTMTLRKLRTTPFISTRPMSCPMPKRISISAIKPNTVVMALEEMADTACCMAFFIASSTARPRSRSSLKRCSVKDRVVDGHRQLQDGGGRPGHKDTVPTTTLLPSLSRMAAPIASRNSAGSSQCRVARIRITKQMGTT